MLFVGIDDLGIMILRCALQGTVILQMHMTVYHIFWLVFIQKLQECLVSLMCMIFAVTKSLSRGMGQQNVKTMVQDQLVLDM